MRCGQRQWRVAGYGLVLALALTGSGCAAVLIGGAVAGGAAAGYAYYKGSMSLDFAAKFDQTWAACLAALPDLDLPIVQQSMATEHGEIQSRSPDGETINLTLEPVTTASGAGTRVHIRVGIFGNEPLSQKIHAQISNRLQNPGPIPAGTPGVVPPVATPTGTPPMVALPKETAPPPLVGGQETVVPVSNPTKSGPIAIPVSTSPGKSSGK